MSRNGSGVYTPPAASYPAVSGTLIEAAKFNAVIDDISTALTESVAINGQTAMTGDLPMGSHKITGLANGTSSTDACAYGQVSTVGTAAMVAASTKATPVDADLLPLADSAASFGLKNLTWANLKATIKAYFDGIYAAKGANSDITSIAGLTTPLSVAQGGTGTSAGVVQIQPISASAGSNALTISASSLTLDFRSTTLGSGTVTTVSGAPANLVISAGSTLGTIGATQSRIVVLALNNAGAIELAAVNIAGGNDLTETGLISTTAEGGVGGADSASAVYSTTARTNVAYRVIGYIESTQATAGTWAAAPSAVQGYGGQALAAMSSLGYGQKWQNVSASRSLGVTYYNTTGRPISAIIGLGVTATNTHVVYIDGLQVAGHESASSGVNSQEYTIIIPPGSSYSATNTATTITRWVELR